MTVMTVRLSDMNIAKANTATKGFAVGTIVAINEQYAWFYPTAMNILWEITDASLLNGRYVYTLWQVGGGHKYMSGISPSDFHKVPS